MREFTDNMRPLQNSANLYKPPAIIKKKKKNTSIRQAQGQHLEIKERTLDARKRVDVDRCPTEMPPTHIRQRRGGEPRRREAHLYCINNFQFNLAPIKKKKKKHIFPGHWFKGVTAKQKQQLEEWTS